jgi:hypothetical protein
MPETYVQKVVETRAHRGTDVDVVHPLLMLCILCYGHAVPRQPPETPDYTLMYTTRDAYSDPASLRVPLCIHDSREEE